MTSVLSEKEKEDLRELYDSLPVTPRVYDPYPVARKKLAEWVHHIDARLKEGTWPYWRSWTSWNFRRDIMTYCFMCRYPARLIPTTNISTGALKKLECEICGLIHYDVRHD